MAKSLTRLQKITAHLSSSSLSNPDPKTRDMTSFRRLVRFESFDGSKAYFHDLEGDNVPLPSEGERIKAYSSFQDLLQRRNSDKIAFKKLLAPLPYSTNQPIYCVGVNFKIHAEEAKLAVPEDPMLWVKPAAALAAPEQNIPINEFCASSWPDYEGELVFVTSHDCRDVSPAQASDYILGYSIGNDLSCRKHQMVEQGGGQFYFAKGFDGFGPIGPVLVSPAALSRSGDTTMTTKVNGKVRQSANCFKEFIWTPAQILSHMSQGTTIPAGTAVMTGTPGGVGVFQNPPQALKHGDIVEIEVAGIGILRNKIIYV